MKDYIEKRAMEIAEFIINTESTVRQTAKKFGVSKSTVHTDVRKMKEIFTTIWYFLFTLKCSISNRLNLMQKIVSLNKNKVVVYL